MGEDVWLSRGKSIGRLFFALTMLASVIIYSYILRSGSWNLIWPATSLMIPVIMAAIWLCYRRFEAHDPDLSDSRWLGRLFVMIYLSSIVLILLLDARGTAYFILIGCLFVLMFLQILASRDKRNSAVLLLQVVLVQLNLAWSMTLVNPAYYGGGDVFSHIQYARIVQTTSHTIPIDLDPSYAFFPSYHVLVASLTEVTGVTLGSSLFIVGSVVSTAVLLFTYGITSRLTHNPMLPLMTVLFLSFLSIFVYYSYYPVARTAGFAAGLMLIMLMVNRGCLSSRPGLDFAALIGILAVVTLHSATVVQLLLIMCGLVLLNRYFGDNRRFRLGYIAVLGLVATSYWILIATTFSTSIISYLVAPREFGLVGVVAVEIDLWCFVQDHAWMTVMLFFSFVGIGLALERRTVTRAFVMLGGVLLLFYVPNPIKQSDFLLVHLGFYRFEMFSEPFLAIALSVGVLGFISQKTSVRGKASDQLRIAVVLALAFLFAVSSITTSSNASDFREDTPSRFFTEPDLEVISFIEGDVPSSSGIFSDYFVYRYFYTHRNFSKSVEFGFVSFESGMIGSTNQLDCQHGYILLRVGELRERGMLLFGDTATTYEFRMTEENLEALTTALVDSGQIYDSGYDEVFCC